MHKLTPAVVLASLAVVGLYTFDAAPSTSTLSSTSTEERAAGSIVGNWQTNRTCRGLVRALDEEGLRALAPGVVGDYFPGRTAKQLARKRDLCRGATPQLHSHFFTADGGFGSLDQNDQQVDDGPYRLVNARTLKIGDEDRGPRFRFRIAEDTELTLKPLISARLKRKALADPLEFSSAGWAVAVAYRGHTWDRVECAEWC